MRKIILILLIAILTQSCYYQNGHTKYTKMPESFSIENKTIINWEKIYVLKENEKIEDLKNNLKLKISNDFIGSISDNQCKCPGGSIFMDWNFNFNYKIDVKDNRYRVSISNIIFKNGMQYYYYGVTTTKDISTLEYFALKNNGEFKISFQNKANLECLDRYFTKLFTIQQNSKKDW